MTQRPDTDDYAAILLADSPLIDTRAPIEYAKGGLPNSINLPLMSDEEREKVGTCYKQQGQQKAIELGHQLVSGELKQQRVKAWTDFAQRHPEGYIYCFRGGLRSNTSRQWMRDVGVDYPLIKGGYKAVRRYLIDLIDQQAAEHPWLILSGRTGTGKTRVLDRIEACIDLEGLANHRGSSFGRRVKPQPTQIDFENALGVAMLKKLQQDQGPWMLEDESRLIGRLSLPLSLHEAMGQAPIVVLEEPMALRIEQVRADYVEDLCAEYVSHYGEQAGFQSYADYMLQSLHRVRKRLGLERHEQIRALMQQALDQHRQHQDISLHDQWIEAMLSQYYDPMYDYQLSKKQERVLFRGNQQQVIDWFADYRRQHS
ncbi:tRNA 2-selenouridine(34) synthase MnmH [Motiliproteus coralliicola]|uniref:tRNA 2-selenouridine synthase n=1 Tax=Motiliproteus coralliicola TaxID=2283196 RepID=A0A369WT48_9GAMM|nr:tRNA 2-selenouridine(34) synthase MnmH [Motiliproteus coralliicola]RDE24751.1 tRNA 2-selenouridine(34) synthase MnmH [Motiliproteus coralliicola]